MSDEEPKEKHPAYGMVGFYRVSGNPGRLFGSSLKNHESYIALRIGTGERIHSNGWDRYYGSLRGEHVEVMLSSAQFAELLTSMNVGNGVPCTIAYLGGKKVERAPEDAEIEVVDLLLLGHRVATIASLLFVSPHTVRNRLKSIFPKLGVHSQVELVRLARGMHGAA